MFYSKQGFPEEGELVLCTVTSVQYHSVFVNLDEYRRNGMIHISEVSPGRIRNIRDYVKEGKKVVCKVLRIHRDRGHIDLSLRRVNDSEKRRKIESIKKEQSSEKIIEMVAKKLKVENETFYSRVTKPILKHYGMVSECFEDLVVNKVSLKDIGVPEKYCDALEDAIRQRMKPPEVVIRRKLSITTFDPRGVDVVKDALNVFYEVDKENISLSYLGSGSYRVIIKAPNYKRAEKVLDQGTKKVVSLLEKHDGHAVFAKGS